MQSDLFGNDINDITEHSKIRTLGFYQPFCSLMECGKVETRWVKTGKKPPFPLGMYLFYTTKEPANKRIYDWCSLDDIELINMQPTYNITLNGYALYTAELYKVVPLTQTDLSYVKFFGTKIFFNKDGLGTEKTQWALHFKNIQAIEPFEWEYGKQGTGFVPQSEISKIKF